MAYDETLADRIRAAVTTVDGNVTERKMFGGLAFMFNGHMFAGVVGQDLMLRLGEPAASHALNRPHVREMDFTGRPMKGMVFVEPDGPQRTRAATVGRRSGSVCAVASSEGVMLVDSLPHLGQGCVLGMPAEVV